MYNLDDYQEIFINGTKSIEYSNDYVRDLIDFLFTLNGIDMSYDRYMKMSPSNRRKLIRNLKINNLL